MGTKPSFYLGQLAKMCEWTVDHAEKHVNVPESELQRARDDLVVKHFIEHGYFIQSCIDAPKNIVFNPATRVVEVVKKEFEIGDKFKIKSSLCELEIVRSDKKIELKYTNRNKHNLLTSFEQLQKVVKLEYWLRI